MRTISQKSHRLWSITALNILRETRIGDFNTKCILARKNVSTSLIDFILNTNPTSVRIEGMDFNFTAQQLGQLNAQNIKTTHIHTEALDPITMDQIEFPWTEIRDMVHLIKVATSIIHG